MSSHSSVLRRRPRTLAIATTVTMLALVLPPVAAEGQTGYLTSEAPLIALDAGVPGGSRVIAIINSGDELGDFTFEGLPDGIGLAPGPTSRSVDVYVNHEQSTVPFLGAADHEDASVSQLTLSTRHKNRGSVLSASTVVSPDEGYIRFCSAFMAGPADGFTNFTFFTGEESNDVLAVPAGAQYGADPSLAPNRQAGYVVAYDTGTGVSTPIPGMGRMNHENTITVGGNWSGVAMLTTDDTFSGPSAQLYLYTAASGDDVLADNGGLWAFQVTATDAGPVDPSDPFNGANDYGDLQPGEDFQGRFIPVPEDVAKGTSSLAPQTALEEWSNANNVFQFVRLEDLATDPRHPNVVYLADTGRTQVIPNPATGRLFRGPTGTVGLSDNGSVFKMVFDRNDPLKVNHFSVLAQGDDAGADLYVPFISPDNIGISSRSIMVQEDAANARIWQYRFHGGTWRVVAHVTDPVGESSGIVDASKAFGPGWWVLDVQAHGSNDFEELVGDVLIKREDGQLLLMKIPGS